jgi:hypothetical protein
MSEFGGLLCSPFWRLALHAGWRLRLRAEFDRLPIPLAAGFLVGLDRLELSTSPLSGARSSHLSYRPVIGRGPVGQRPELVELVGIEPATS